MLRLKQQLFISLGSTDKHYLRAAEGKGGRRPNTQSHPNISASVVTGGGFGKDEAGLIAFWK